MNQNRVLKLIKGCLRRIVIYNERAQVILKILRHRNFPTIYLFGAPRHSNMGDQAQTYCIIEWSKKYYPSYGIIVFNMYISTDFILKLLRRYIKPCDKIFFHSGYHLTDLYKEKEVYCKILNKFKDHHILAFPQTINFVYDKSEEKRVAGVYNKHSGVMLCCRDEVSYQKAQELFRKCRLLLFPDIVTTLIGKRYYTTERNGVLLCVRNDIEAFYSREQIQLLIDMLSKEAFCKKTDTTLSLSYLYVRKNRGHILESIFKEYAKYKVVITDRYHGTIFSLIAGTPVVVLSSKDHKLSSGVKWFPQSFSQYVHYAENLEVAYNTALDILENNSLSYRLSPYFEEYYYSKLKDYYEAM